MYESIEVVRIGEQVKKKEMMKENHLFIHT